MGYVGLKGLHWRVENTFLKVWISDKWNLVSGPRAGKKIFFNWNLCFQKCVFNSSVQPKAQSFLYKGIKNKIMFDFIAFNRYCSVIKAWRHLEFFYYANKKTCCNVRKHWWNLFKIFKSWSQRNVYPILVFVVNGFKKLKKN